MNKNKLGLNLVILYVLVVIILMVFINNFDIYYTLGSMVWWFGKFVYGYIPLGAYGSTIFLNIMQILIIYFVGNYLQKFLRNRQKKLV